MKTEDGYIVHECINGDKSAFAILIDKYKAAVFAIAYDKLRNFHDAQDVAQEVFIKAFQKLNTLKNYDKFAVWIHSITNNLCKNYIRSQSRRPDSEFLEDQDRSVIDNRSMESFRDDIENEMINDALNSLPEIYRQVLTLHYLGGMRDSEIAEMLGMSHTNVRQKLMKARTQLKEEMISMMGRVYEEQKLQAGFTFRVVEMIKRTKIQPITQTKGLPWGLSLAVGLIGFALSINPHLIPFNWLNFNSISTLASESKVLKVGEIPVSMEKTYQVSFISGNIGKGKGGNPNGENAFFMAPQGEGGTWARKADMITARSYLCTSVVNGKIYAIGGFTQNFERSSLIEEYNPVTDEWIQKADMPTARWRFATGVVNGKIYAFGGLIGDQLVGPACAITEEYDPAKDKWIKKADMPIANAECSASMVNGKIYIIGGSYKPVQEYDPSADKWTLKSDIPTLRWLLSTIAVNGKIYAIGGSVMETSKPSSIVEEYNPLTDIWAKKADMPISRSGLSTCVVNGKIYVFGGAGGANNPPGTAVDIYNPIIDAWTKKADMSAARYHLSTSVVNNKIYVIGGQVGPDFHIGSEVEEYTPDDWQPSISVSPQGKLPNTWGKIKAK